MENWRKLIAGCAGGNILELYDFILYGYFSHVLAKLFFPSANQYISLILIFGVFASGCFMRPVGAILFGYIGDRYGRKKSLIISVSLISISTTLIGVLPTYQQIGLYAPILLVFCRLFQGLSMSGEETGAAIFLTENAPKNRHALAGSIIFGSIYTGLLLGSLVALITTVAIPHKSLIIWGWRIPFILSLFFGIVALIVRTKQMETSVFTNLQKNNQVLANPVKHVFRNNYKELINATALVSLMSVVVYIFAVYMPAYFNVTEALSLKLSMLICSFAFLAASVFVVIVGNWTDKVGSKLPMKLSCFCCIFLSYVLFFLLSRHSVFMTMLAEIIIVILLGLTAGSIMPMLIHSFPVNVRSTGVNIAFNMSMTIFGSTAPLIVTYLIKTTNNNRSPFVYMVFVAIVTLAAVIFAKHDKPIEG